MCYNELHFSQNRLKEHYHQVDNNAEELLAENSYNEKGQLTGKKVGNNLQNIDYTYNIRGWMTGINDPSNLNGKLFGYDILYQNPTDAGLSPNKYNGNISEVNWKIASNQILKRYAYQYDGLNRLTKGTFLNPDVVVPQNNWNNEQVSYDLNGNIKTLKRNARNLYSNTAELIDDLDYKYLGNRVTQIKDYSNNPTGYEGGGGDIGYDENGNMKFMPDKQIEQIGYNYLNLPNAMKIDDTKKKMLYLYRADGTKLRKTFNFIKQDGSVYTTITDYLDGFQYLSTVGSEPNEMDPMEFAYEQEAFIDGAAPDYHTPTLSFFPTAEGFYDYERKEYIYQYKDHLGNVRVSYKKNAGGFAEITDQNDYYPFGMNILREEKAIFGVNSLYNYKYNGKELQETGAYDFGARQYMPDIARWIVPDPLSEKHPDLNPMMYANNNPIRFIDPDGMDWVESKNGDITWRDDVTAKNYKDKGVLQKGETYRGTYYERAKTWDNKRHKGLVLEMYHTSGKMDYSPAKEVNVEITGEMRNSKIGDVDVKLNATFENGKTKNIGSYEAVAGGFGNGAPENGEYTVDSYQDRSPNGWYNKGMNRDGVGFSFNLNPQFSTGRSLLRIHPDGNNEGTLGCIGMSGDKIILTNFRDTLRSMIKTGGPVPVNINIQNNPNNNGKSGTKIPNVNE